VMSFGMTEVTVETHIAGLHQTRGARRAPGRSSPLARVGLGAAGSRLRTRVGLGLVEAGLHLMVRARQSGPPTPYGAALLRRSSTARGR
jgi:hypothetical protein